MDNAGRDCPIDISKEYQNLKPEILQHAVRYYLDEEQDWMTDAQLTEAQNLAEEYKAEYVTPFN